MSERVGPTPSQTVGPYFTIVLGQTGQNIVAPAGVPGTRIRVEGRVLDGDRVAIDDALIELWQANSVGRYRHRLDARDEFALHDGFTGFGSATTEFQTGRWWLETIKPGPVPDPHGALQAPHLNLVVQARGMLMPSFTRMYFPEDADAHEHDIVLSAVPPHRRATLIASGAAPSSAAADNGPLATYSFEIRFQGDDETVFFDL
jgi:protocatechuate 3,4-dioxygenase, alpha subunit